MMQSVPETTRQGPGRFDYVKYDDAAAVTQATFKLLFENLADNANKILAKGRAQSLVLTKLEEAYMWVGKAIRDEQIARGGDQADQPKRGE